MMPEPVFIEVIIIDGLWGDTSLLFGGVPTLRVDSIAEEGFREKMCW